MKRLMAPVILMLALVFPASSAASEHDIVGEIWIDHGSVDPRTGVATISGGFTCVADSTWGRVHIGVIQHEAWFQDVYLPGCVAGATVDWETTVRTYWGGKFRPGWSELFYFVDQVIEDDTGTYNHALYAEPMVLLTATR